MSPRSAMIAISAFAAITSLSVAAYAVQDTKKGLPNIPGKVDPSRVSAGEYALDPSHSQIVWEVDHFGFNKYTGMFGDVTGSMTIDPSKLADTKVEITIPIEKVVTNSVKLTDHLLTKDFFDAEKFAQARFVSTNVTISPDNANKAIINGNLTIRDVTKPVQLDAEFTGAGINPFSKKETVGFEAMATIKRSDFGVNYAIPLVEDQVDLQISVAFEKQ